MTGEADIRMLDKCHKPVFVSLMCRAFAADPLFRHLYPGTPSEREQAMRPFMSFMFDASGLRGDMRLGLFRDGTLAVCALVELPDAGPVRSFAGQLLTLMRFAPLAFRLTGAEIKFLNNYMRYTRRAAPKVAHHYLAMIGVDPGFQGQGLGRRMIARLIDIADRHRTSAGIALDTENDANLVFYQRLGFLLRARVDIGPCQAVCLFRPRGDAA